MFDNIKFETRLSDDTRTLEAACTKNIIKRGDIDTLFRYVIMNSNFNIKKKQSVRT